MAKRKFQIDQLIINSPYGEPSTYWSYDREIRMFERVSRGGAIANLGVAFGTAEASVQPESAASLGVARKVAWLAELRQSPSATISRRAVNKKATGFRGGGKTSPNVTVSNALSRRLGPIPVC